MDQPTAGTTPQPAPPTAKRRIRNEEGVSESRIGLPEAEYSHLGVSHEDVLDPGIEITPPPAPALPASPSDATTSVPSDKVYIQEVAGFRKALRQRFEISLAEKQKKAALEEAGQRVQREYTPDEAIQAGIASQNVFRTLAVTLQGLLAGFSMAHCLMVVLDMPPYYSNLHFLSHYAPLALPGHCLYYVALVICCLAALDRYDIGQGFPRVLYRAITFQSGGLSILCYMAAAVLNEIPISVDERMDVFYKNYTNADEMLSQSNKLEDPSQEAWMEADVQLLRGCLIAKAVLATLAWIMIAMRPNTDLLVKHLGQTDTEFAKDFQATTVSKEEPIVALSNEEN